ncbi:MAG TPA: hypothetical protein VMH05_14180 [Bryobacteraceae bacterium]|nr:hypothetical protein [Bryobacteraceae bacterium]
MSLKSAAFLATIGMIILTALMLYDLFENVAGILRDLIPAVALFRSAIYAFASITVTIFFFAFYKRQ